MPVTPIPAHSQLIIPIPALYFKKAFVRLNAHLTASNFQKVHLPLHLPYRFEKSVEQLSGDHYSKTFSTWQQFLTCLYVQIIGKDSLREIERGLLANQKRLYHLGMTAVAKLPLAETMNRRNPDMFKALFNEILDWAVACVPGHKFRLHNPLHAIDSTTIDLCLNQYDWAHYRKNKGVIKLHTELDLSGNLPCFVVMSNGKMSDIRGFLLAQRTISKLFKMYVLQRENATGQRILEEADFL